MAIKLTMKQEKFVQEVIRTGNQRQAYKTAYPNTRMSEASVDSEASAMLNGTGKYAKNPKVSKRYHELLAEAEKIKEEQQRKNILTRLDREELLSEIAKKKTAEDSDRIRAIDVLNRMNADYTDKVNIEGSVPIVLTGYDDVED